MKQLKVFGKQLLSWGEIEEPSVITKKTHKFGYGYEDYVGRSDNQLSLKDKRELVNKEPLLKKAIYKKNMDIISKWFTLKPLTGSKVPVNVTKIVNDFEKRSRIKSKLFTAGVCSDIYGTGFVERTFMTPKSKDTPKGLSNMDVYDKDGVLLYEPLGLKAVNSEFITSTEKVGDTTFWVYNEYTDKQYLHPNRFIDVTNDRLPYSSFGISKVDVLHNILTSKMNADTASGETLAWFSHGILDMTKNDMNPEEQKDIIKVFKQHPSYYAHDEDYTLQVHNPTQINPEPFYKYFYTNIAAAMIMTTNMVTGQELGDITGSEVGYSAYVQDVQNIQKIFYTPIVEKLYKDLLEYHGLSWKYEIDWNDIFVDELSEGKILQIRSYSAVNAKNAGIIDVSEARHILNEGIVNLDIDKEIEQEPKDSSFPPSQPNVAPQPVEKSPTVKQQDHTRIYNIVPLNAEQNDMIKKIVERERKIGDEVIKEQDELFPVKKKKNG